MNDIIIKKLLKNDFLKKMSIYFIGTLSSNLINVLLLPLYAYFVTAENLGEYDYILSLANMFVPIVYLCIWESVLKYGIKATDDKEQLFSNLVFLQIVLSCVGFAAFIIVSALEITQVSLVTILMFVISQGWTQVWQYSARAYGHSRLYVIAGIAGSVSVILIDAIFIFYGCLNWVGLSISHIASQLLIWIVLECKMKLLSKLRINLLSLKLIKKILAFSVPLVINNVALWFYSGGIRLVIKNSLGATDTGMYSFASKFSVIITLCGTVVSMAFTEEVYGVRSMEEYKRKTSRMITVISKTYFSVILLALPVIYILYSIAFKNTEYYMSSDYVFALLLSVLFTALSNSYGTAFQVTTPKFIALTTLIGGITAISVSLLLVKQIGIYAILIAAIIGPFVMMFARAIYAKKVTGVSIDWKYNILLLSVSGCINFLLSVNKRLHFQCVILLCVILFCMISYRKEIRLLMKGRK